MEQAAASNLGNDERLKAAAIALSLSLFHHSAIVPLGRREQEDSTAAHKSGQVENDDVASISSRKQQHQQQQQML
jgi:hypothetical protein